MAAPQLAFRVELWYFAVQDAGAVAGAAAGHAGGLPAECGLETDGGAAGGSSSRAAVRSPRLVQKAPRMASAACVWTVGCPQNHLNDRGSC